MVVAKRQRREKSSAGFGSSFYVFPPPLGSLCKLGQPGVLFVLPEVLTLVLGPSFVYFAGFPLFVFWPPLFWTPFSYSNYLTFPPQEMEGPIICK